MVGTEDASAGDELSPATATVLLLRDDSWALFEVLLPSPWNVISHTGIVGSSWAGSDTEVWEGSVI